MRKEGYILSNLVETGKFQLYDVKVTSFGKMLIFRPGNVNFWVKYVPFPGIFTKMTKKVINLVELVKKEELTINISYLPKIQRSNAS